MMIEILGVSSPCIYSNTFEMARIEIVVSLVVVGEKHMHPFGISAREEKDSGPGTDPLVLSFFPHGIIDIS